MRTRQWNCWGDVVAVALVANFIIDLPTLCLVTGFVIVIGGLLLLFSWTQNRHEGALALWGLGYLIGAAGALLMAIGRVNPEGWAMCGAYALICCAYGVLWSGARSFEGRRVRVFWVLAGAAIWLGACQIGAFYQSAPARIVLSSAVLGAYTLLSAGEVWRAQDKELMSRWPTMAILILHAGFLLGRIPFAASLPAALIDGTSHRAIVYAMALEALFAIFCLAFLRVNMAKERAELRQKKAALTDPLTGIANRRAFFDLGERMIDRFAAERQPVALLLFDIDRFKEVNDTAGHQVGDCVLQAFSSLVAGLLSRSDLFGRLGGEEFSCLLAHTSMSEALQLAERVRREFAAIRIPWLKLNATVSIGVAVVGETNRDLPALLATADRALYRAKAEGRNRVAPGPFILVDGGARDARLAGEVGRPAAFASPMAG